MAVLTIFCLILQIVINLRMLSIGGWRWKEELDMHGACENCITSSSWWHWKRKQPQEQ